MEMASTTATTGRARFEHFDHGADIGVRGYGSTLAEAFEQAALALTAVVADVDSVGADTRVAISCRARDAETLLVDWLNALVFEMAVGKLLFSRFEVSISDGVLEASAWGESIDPIRHKPAVEVKGATFTALDVRRLDDGTWVAETVVDV